VIIAGNCYLERYFGGEKERKIRMPMAIKLASR
jgi:hypothetical protein